MLGLYCFPEPSLYRKCSVEVRACSVEHVGLECYWVQISPWKFYQKASQVATPCWALAVSTAVKIT